MDRNSVIGLLLIAVVLIVFSWLNQPSQEEIEANRAKQDSIANVQLQQESAKVQAQEQPVLIATDVNSTDSATVQQLDTIPTDSVSPIADLIEQYGIFANAVDAPAQSISIENEKISIHFSNLGGKIASVELKEYKTYQGEPLMLFEENNNDFGVYFKYKNRDFFTTNQFYFQWMDSSFSISGEAEKSFRARLNTSDPSKYIEFIYTLKGNSYDVDAEARIVGLNKDLDLMHNDLTLHWKIKGLNNEKNIDNERQQSTVFYKYFESDRDYLSESSEDEEELEARTQWVAFKQNFFSAVLISEEGFLKEGSNVRILPEEGPQYTKTFETNLSLVANGVENISVPFRFYFGPNHYQTLKSYDIGMEGIINLGWGIFGWVNKFIVIPIFNFLDQFNWNYGVIILVLTVLIKLILSPLTYKNYLSSAKMRTLKPELEELNQKFKDEDPIKKQQATMALYRQTGVNPMAGCIPMVIQLPILYAMFRFFPSSIELRQEGFLWADDLSSYDSILELPFSIPFYGDHVSLFTLLMCFSTLFYTRMNSGQMPENSNMPNMKVMMYIFPFMMLFFFNGYSSALSYYYFTANIISIGQMFLIKKYFVNEEEIRKKIQENKKRPKSAKKSKFQKRLEEMAKQRGYKGKV